MAETLRDYLASLGFALDEAGLATFTSLLNDVAGTVIKLESVVEGLSQTIIGITRQPADYEGVAGNPDVSIPDAGMPDAAIVQLLDMSGSPLTITESITALTQYLSDRPSDPVRQLVQTFGINEQILMADPQHPPLVVASRVDLLDRLREKIVEYYPYIDGVVTPAINGLATLTAGVLRPDSDVETPQETGDSQRRGEKEKPADDAAMDAFRVLGETVFATVEKVSTFGLTPVGLAREAVSGAVQPGASEGDKTSWSWVNDIATWAGVQPSAVFNLTNNHAVVTLLDPLNRNESYPLRSSPQDNRQAEGGAQIQQQNTYNIYGGSAQEIGSEVELRQLSANAHVLRTNQVRNS